MDSMTRDQAVTGISDAGAQTFYRELERNHLVALWNVNKSLLPKEPRAGASRTSGGGRPCCRWSDEARRWRR